jgi:hypothetical protein
LKSESEQNNPFALYQVCCPQITHITTISLACSSEVSQQSWPPSPQRVRASAHCPSRWDQTLRVSEIHAAFSPALCPPHL